MTYKVICAWCGGHLGFKRDNQPELAEPITTHSICLECKQKVLTEIKSISRKGDLS